MDESDIDLIQDPAEICRVVDQVRRPFDAKRFVVELGGGVKAGPNVNEIRLNPNTRFATIDPEFCNPPTQGLTKLIEAGVQVSDSGKGLANEVDELRSANMLSDPTLAGYTQDGDKLLKAQQALVDQSLLMLCQGGKAYFFESLTP